MRQILLLCHPYLKVNVQWDVCKMTLMLVAEGQLFVAKVMFSAGQVAYAHLLVSVAGDTFSPRRSSKGILSSVCLKPQSAPNNRYLPLQNSAVA